MRSDDGLGNGDGRLPARAAAAGLAALYAAALAAGLFDGAPPGRRHGRPAAAFAVARPAMAGEHGPALPPGPRLCLLGPGGEVVEFPAARRGRQAPAEPGCPSSGTARS